MTRVARLRLYLEHLENCVPIENKKDKENIIFLKSKMNTCITKMGVFSFARGFFYVILYASLVSNFIGDLVTPETSAFLTRFASPIMILSTILGTTISLAYILLFSRFVNIYWEDVRTYSTNLIALYAKYDSKGVALEEHKKEED